MPAPLPTRRFSDRPLRPEPAVAVYIVEHGRPLPADAALMLLPGSKATRADLAALRAEGWDVDLRAHVRRGGLVVGLCGGYQMLGTRIADPGGVEGPAGDSGLGRASGRERGGQAVQYLGGPDALKQK